MVYGLFPRMPTAPLVELVEFGKDVLLNGDVSKTPVRPICIAVNVFDVPFGTPFSRLLPTLAQYAPGSANAVCVGSAYLEKDTEVLDPTAIARRVLEQLTAPWKTEDDIVWGPRHDGPRVPRYQQVAAYLQIPEADYQRGIALKSPDWFFPGFREENAWSDDRSLCGAL